MEKAVHLIRLKPKTKQKLIKLKLLGESYDDVVIKLINK